MALNYINKHIPSDRNRKLLQFCSEINKNKPFYVKIDPQEYSQENECFFNVKAHIEKNGGSLVCGWFIVEFQNIMLEAQFHGIWESSESQHLDVTPHQLNVKQNLFLPDENMQYDFSNPDKVICNKRFPLTDNDLIHCLFNTLYKIHKLKEKYPHGLSLWTEGDTAELYKLESLKATCFSKFNDINKRRSLRRKFSKR